MDIPVTLRPTNYHFLVVMAWKSIILCVAIISAIQYYFQYFPCLSRRLARLLRHKPRQAQGRIQDFEMGGEFCNNVREIKFDFNIWGIRKKKERRGLRKRGVKIHPFHLPWIRAWSVMSLKDSKGPKVSQDGKHLKTNADFTCFFSLERLRIWY